MDPTTIITIIATCVGYFKKLLDLSMFMSGEMIRGWHEFYDVPTILGGGNIVFDNAHTFLSFLTLVKQERVLRKGREYKKSLDSESYTLRMVGGPTS